MNITLHPGQSRIFSDLFVEKKVQHAVGCCARGFGKSHLAAVAATAAVHELMELPSHIPNKNVAIIAPTHSQVTDVYFDLLMYQLGLKNIVTKATKDNGRLEFPNNVLLKLFSFEAIDRLRGTGLYFVVNDEVRDWKTLGGFQDAWESVLYPCLATRWSPKQAKAVGAKSACRSLTISTPSGYDYFYEMSKKQETDSSYKTYVYDYTRAPLLDLTEIEKVKADTDPIKFAREYGASFKESGASVFYCFDRETHVKKDLPDIARGNHDNPGEDIHIGIDFNVLINASSIFCIRNSEVHFLDEISGTADTDTLARTIRGRFWPNYDNPGSPEYKKKICRIFVYPDPAGNQRKTSAPVGVTDHSILEKYGFTVRTKAAHPKIVDSVNCVNRLLKAADGKVRLFIHPRCKGLIKSLERTVWLDKNTDLATIDKTKGDEHFSDGIRYAIEYLFPINQGTKASHRGFSF